VPLLTDFSREFPKLAGGRFDSSQGYQLRFMKFHYIYKITRFDGKYYIGLHTTNDLNDGYFGSGKYIKSSIKHHGLDKHLKEILEFLPNQQKLKDREKEIVNEECIADPLCMNLKVGGEGGWDYVNSDPVIRKKNTDAIRLTMSKESSKIKCGIAGAKGAEIVNSDRTPAMKKQTEKMRESWTGRSHSEDSKNKMRETLAGKQSGTNNSQAGTRWVTNGIETIKIKKGEDPPRGFRFGRTLRTRS